MDKNLSYSVGHNAISQFDMPVVSVIISNYNYAEYLEPCLNSVLSQTYDKIEIILVDDKSTDHSATVLDKIEAAHDNVLVIRRQENGGQSAATLDGLKHASGAFIIFLDADDILLPYAVASHLHVHMSLRYPVGFTCADMLQIGGNTLMGASCLPLNRFVAANPERRFSPRDATADIIPFPPSAPKNLLAQIYIAEPWDANWVWSATSAIMFRRDALTFWEDTPGLADLRYSLDAFFCYGINAICGSVVIDLPLAAYRIHGRNGFAARLPLNHIRTHDCNSQGERSLDALQLLLKQAQQKRSYFRNLLWSEKQYRSLLEVFERSIMKLTENNKKAKLHDSMPTIYVILKQKLFSSFRQRNAPRLS